MSGISGSSSGSLSAPGSLPASPLGTSSGGGSVPGAAPDAAPGGSGFGGYGSASSGGPATAGSGQGSLQYWANFNFTPFTGFPSASPPAGIKSNLNNPQRFNAAPIAVGSVFLAIAIFFLVCRIYSRLWMKRRLKWDDWACIVGFLGMLTAYIAAMLACTIGNSGYHAWDVTVGNMMEDRQYIYGDVFTFGSLFATTFIKLSFFIMYWNIFRPLAWMRWAVMILGTLVIASNVALNIVNLVLITAPPGESWFKHLLSTPDFVGLPGGGVVANGICNLVGDIIVFALPIPAVCRLQMSLRRRIGVISIFSVGILAVAASAVSTWYRISTQNGSDISYYWSWIYVLRLIEFGVGIGCASAPCAVKVLQKLNSVVKLRLSFLRGLSSYFSRSSRHRAHSGTGTSKGSSEGTLFGRSGRSSTGKPNQAQHTGISRRWHGWLASGSDRTDSTLRSNYMTNKSRRFFSPKALSLKSVDPPLPIMRMGPDGPETKEGGIYYSSTAFKTAPEPLGDFLETRQHLDAAAQAHHDQDSDSHDRVNDSPV